MKNQKSQPAEKVKRTAVYIAPAAYGDPVDLNEALKQSRAYVKKKKDLKLMRIYRDEKVTVTGSTEGQTGKRSRSPLGAEGNDAWKRLLTDIETSAVEAVIIYAARTVAPTITDLATMIGRYFIPCGIRFIDVEAEFDTADGDAESYIRKKTSEYRSTVRRKPYEKRNKEGRLRTCYGGRKYRGVRTDHRKNGVDRYVGYIKIDGKAKYLGTYATREEAAMAHDEESRRVYGDGALYNFPRPGERDCRTGEVYTGEEAGQNEQTEPDSEIDTALSSSDDNS